MLLTQRFDHLINIAFCHSCYGPFDVDQPKVSEFNFRKNLKFCGKLEILTFLHHHVLNARHASRCHRLLIDGISE